MLSAALLFFVLFTGCKSTGPKFDPLATQLQGTNAQFVATTNANPIKPEWLTPSREPFRLGPGDSIEIEKLGPGGTRVITFVCPDGKIYYDLLAGLEVQCR